MFVKRLHDHLLPETGYLRMIFESDSAAIRTQISSLATTTAFAARDYSVCGLDYSLIMSLILYNYTHLRTALSDTLKCFPTCTYDL